MNLDLDLLYIRQIVLNLLALPIPVLLMFQILHRKHRTTELKIFFRMLVMNMLQCLAYTAAFLLLYYMFRRLSFIDPATGFFNEKHLNVLDSEADKKDIHDAVMISFKTYGDQKKLAEILKSWEPEHSKIIIKDDGEFLIFSEKLKKSLVERFIFLVQENCSDEGLETEDGKKYHNSFSAISAALVSATSFSISALANSKQAMSFSENTPHSPFLIIS